MLVFTIGYLIPALINPHVFGAYNAINISGIGHAFAAILQPIITLFKSLNPTTSVFAYLHFAACLFAYAGLFMATALVAAMTLRILYNIGANFVAASKQIFNYSRQMFERAKKAPTTSTRRLVKILSILLLVIQIILMAIASIVAGVLSGVKGGLHNLCDEIFSREGSWSNKFTGDIKDHQL